MTEIIEFFVDVITLACIIAIVFFAYLVLADANAINELHCQLTTRGDVAYSTCLSTINSH